MQLLEQGFSQKKLYIKYNALESLDGRSSSQSSASGKCSLSKDTSMFQSDESYYEEIEKVQLACFNDDELKERLICQSEELINIQLEANKLKFIFDASDILRHPTQQSDKNINQVVDFLTKLPAFGTHFQSLTRL